jgi:glycosyltransferase involved in cell wall biosynthesis
MPTILVVASTSRSLVNFRGPLLTALAAAGHQVHVAAPSLLGDAPTFSWLKASGVTAHDISLTRTGLNPIADAGTFLALLRLMRRTKPDFVLCYTIKPVIWGGLAGAIAGVPHRFALITGLGYAFTGKASGKRWLVQKVAQALYRLALAQAEKVFFQNSDDAALFMQLRLVPATTPVVVVNGSGVDLAYYAVAPLPPLPLRFLLIARLLGDKGVREYAEAARLLRQEYPDIGFDLVGGVDPNPDAISAEEVDHWQAEGTLVWYGAISDVRPKIAAVHVYVLPSYREGTPRTVLEAMAMGRAIVTTDAPGCRETVIEGSNGFLVPVRNVALLAGAMRRFVENPALIETMGRRSRMIAEEKFDVHGVNAAMLREMAL